MPKLRTAVATRVALAADDASRGRDAAFALSARGISCDAIDLDSALEASGAVGFAPAENPSPQRAAAIAPLCSELAAESRPVVILCPAPSGSGQSAIDHAAALAYLRSYGAIVCSDPDEWLESLVLLSCFGCPAGPRTAIVAPKDSWLAASASALSMDAAARGARFSTVYYEAAKVGATDIVLVDRAELPRHPLPRARGALVVPVVGRAEFLADERGPALVGLRAALGAAAHVGRFAQRITEGLGPRRESAVEPDREALARRLLRVGSVAGDHETKLLLAAFDVPVTRQAVATTPSAAARKAKEVGYPVEIKPWGPDVPSERDGCPVERGVTSAAHVRRAYAAVSRELGAPTGSPVIVRETPPRGRELSATVLRLGPLGLTVIIDVPGTPGPIAAPAPLREADAAELSRRVEASRAGDLEPDREALAKLLINAAALLEACDDIERLEMSRIVVGSGGDTAVVVDARCERAEK